MSARLNLLAVLLCVMAWPCSAQRDTIRHKFAPTGIRFGTDLISLIKSPYVRTFDGWELNADVDFYRYYLTADYGTWSRLYEPVSGRYTNDGRYLRVGVDVNFLTKDPEKNMFFIGCRYGRSTFSENYITQKNDTLWGDGLVTNTYQNTDIQARWLELTTGLRVHIWKFIWMGYTARLKFGLKTDEDGVMLPSDVPGFGRTNKETAWGFNYQLFFRLPLPRKK